MTEQKGRDGGEEEGNAGLTTFAACPSNVFCVATRTAAWNASANQFATRIGTNTTPINKKNRESTKSQIF